MNFICVSLDYIKPFITHNLTVKITIYTRTIDEFKQITKTL